MIKRIAAIGDIHGCYEELEQLYNSLCWLSLDEIWHVGDVVDRGPHSGKVLDFCIEKQLKGVLGNHDESIINHWDRVSRGGGAPKNQDKRRTLQEISQKGVDYLKTLPFIHIIDDLNVILVHGGVWPTLPLYKQPVGVCRLQMVHPYQPGRSVWWGDDAQLMFENAKTEEEWRQEGWERWYRVYDHEQHVLFGHSTWSQPMIWQNQDAGRCIGIDTGSSFGGSLTACIMDHTGNPSFMSVKNKKLYYPDAYRAFIEG